VTRDDVERLFFRHVPEEFCRRLLQAVYMAHDLAWKDCESTFAATEAVNVRPIYRRGKLEGYMRNVAERFPHMSSKVVREPERNPWYHTEIIAGVVVLTANTVPEPCALVDKAIFRETLARVNVQLSLLDPEPPTEDLSLYALLLHSRSRWQTPDEARKYGHLPGSAYIAFPNHTLDGYVHEINLFQRHPDVVTANRPAELDQEAFVRYVKRSRKARVA
jgi:hypothetical protein